MCREMKPVLTWIKLNWFCKRSGGWLSHWQSRTLGSDGRDSALIAYNIILRLVKIEESNSWPICSVLTISALQHFATTNALFLGCIVCNGIVRPIARSANYTSWFIKGSVFQNFFFSFKIKFLWKAHSVGFKSADFSRVALCCVLNYLSKEQSPLYLVLKVL
jgi:hypothetical protein